MAVSIFFPVAVYHGFIGRCKLDSRPYEILRNSVLDHPPGLDEQTIVELLCSEENADILLDHAIEYYSPAIQYVIESEGSVSPQREYRRKAGGDTWHVHSACSQWPMERFVSLQKPPANAQFCNECIVKSRISPPKSSP
jgi:hypothetical protein